MYLVTDIVSIHQESSYRCRIVNVSHSAECDDDCTEESFNYETEPTFGHDDFVKY
jgi:hypothetical protein